MKNNNSKLYIVTAPSGAGKSTIMKSIMDNEIVSFTTRKPRAKEIDGKDYIFISKETFEELLHINGLIEYVEYDGNYYGITKGELDEKLNKGNVFWIAEYHGMKQMKSLYNNCVTIFFFAEKYDCEERMRMRGDSESNIQKRLANYDDEILNMCHYDHVVNTSTNSKEETIEIVKDIINGEYI